MTLLPTIVLNIAWITPVAPLPQMQCHKREKRERERKKVQTKQQPKHWLKFQQML